MPLINRTTSVTPGWEKGPVTLPQSPDGVTSKPAADDSGPLAAGKTIVKTGSGGDGKGKGVMPEPTRKPTNATATDPNYVIDALKKGGAPSVTSRPTTQLQSDFSGVLSQSQGTAAAGEMGVLSYVRPRPADAGDGLQGGGGPKPDGNVSSDEAGKLGGFPDAAGGDGKGRQPQTVKGKTNARPRTPFNLPGFTGRGK